MVLNYSSQDSYIETLYPTTASSEIVFSSVALRGGASGIILLMIFGGKCDMGIEFG